MQCTKRQLDKTSAPVCTGDNLYIVMDLLEGASLLEHINALKEKREFFTEERIWKIFLQVLYCTLLHFTVLHCTVL